MPHLALCLDQATEVVTEDLAQDFVDHRVIGPAPDVIAELGLNHRERGFDATPLAVVSKNLFPAELEVVVRLLPERPGLLIWCPIVDLDGNAKNNPTMKRFSYFIHFITSNKFNSSFVCLGDQPKIVFVDTKFASLGIFVKFYMFSSLKVIISYNASKVCVMPSRCWRYRQGGSERGTDPSAELGLLSWIVCSYAKMSKLDFSYRNRRNV